jgi:hypothetical protein
MPENAPALLSALPADLKSVLPCLALDGDCSQLVWYRSCSGSNAVFHLRFAHGGNWIVKIARHPELVRGFDPERSAARLARDQGLLAPDHRPLPPGPEDLAFVAYPRIEQPTLSALWPRIAGQRTAALTSWGALMRRLHRIRLPGAGPLPQALSGGLPASAFLADDLAQRLAPALQSDWPEGQAALHRLMAVVDRHADRIDARPVVLNHGDLFTANILCEPGTPIRCPIRCVGLLDFEDALAAPPEADLARSELLHGPLFGNPLPDGWFDHVLAGYGHDIDIGLVELFKAWHLLNMGYHGALTGHRPHASLVATEALRRSDGLDRSAHVRRLVA